MTVNSFMSVDDLINPGVKWIPSSLQFVNYGRALQVLELPGSIVGTTAYVLKGIIIGNHIISIYRIWFCEI